MQGTGLRGTSSHSYDYRFERSINTFKVFTENPIIGSGFYGLTEKLLLITNDGYCKDYKSCQGMNIFFELIAACGVGSIPLLYFIKYIFYKKIKISFRYNDQLKSLRFSFFLVTFMLMFNQNIFRPYYWILISILFTLVTITKYEKKYIHR